MKIYSANETYGFIFDKQGNRKEVSAPIEPIPTKTICKTRKGGNVVEADYSNTEFVSSPKPTKTHTGKIPDSVGF